MWRQAANGAGPAIRCFADERHRRHAITPNFGAIAQRRITILPAPLQSHIKTANQARSVIGRLEYALQHDRREDAHALAIRSRQLIGEIIDATK